MAFEDPFKQLRHLQRLLDETAPMLKEYERAQRQLREMSVSTRLIDVVREYENINKLQLRETMPLLDALRDYENVHRLALERVHEIESANRLALDAAREVQDTNRNILDAARMYQENQNRFLESLKAAARPILIAPQMWQSSIPSIAWESVSSQLAGLNKAILDAQLIADIDVSPTSEDDETPLTPEKAESQLIEVVSPEVLSELRRVEFAPLVLLDRTFRDPELMRRLEARDFEAFIAALIDQLGFEDVILTPRSGDEGRDIVATLNVHGVSILCALECKRYAKDHWVGPDIARGLLGTISGRSTRAAKGILVTTSYFTKGAKRVIVTEPSLDGRDFDGIVEWLGEYGKKRDR